MHILICKFASNSEDGFLKIERKYKVMLFWRVFLWYYLLTFLHFITISSKYIDYQNIFKWMADFLNVCAIMNRRISCTTLQQTFLFGFSYLWNPINGFNIQLILLTSFLKRKKYKLENIIKNSWIYNISK
jgi:hypothetical protein